MRGRRNTSLSISSCGSADPSSFESIDLNVSEKAGWAKMSPLPVLPVPVTTGDGKSKQTSKCSLTAKLLALTCCLVILWQCTFDWRNLSSPNRLAADETGLSQHELVAATELPDHPTALIIEDFKGSPRWTISIPHNSRFPLAGQDYRDMCSQGQMLHGQITEDNQLPSIRHWLRHESKYGYDRNYVQVDEAVNAGALPRSRREHPHNVCAKSLTFVLGENDASFGKSLLLLWMSYGLAKKEGRAFFIDDSQWPWGRYTSYFQPIPSSHCTGPPPHHIVPCPHNAKHLVVSSATADWTFGPDFDSYFTSPKSRGLAKQSRIYKLLRTGYKSLFKLADEDHHYVEERVATLAAGAAQHQEPVIAMQIRRGDLHPFEYQYNMDYLPFERYVDGVHAYMQRHSPAVDAPAQKSPLKTSLVLASDDPEIFTSPDLDHAIGSLTIQRAQDRILLATKATLDEHIPVTVVRDPGSAYVKHMDENSGWEGGFYTSLFFTLGTGRGNVDALMTEDALRLREFVGRAYLMDLAILSRSDAVVCAISSASCRTLGVMMGWDALKQGRWVNVDDNRIWSWDGRRL